MTNTLRLLAIFALCATAYSAHAATVLSSDFNGVDPTDTTAPFTATNITWDNVNGIDTPAGELTFDNPDGFHGNNANEIMVNRNLTTEGPWSTTLDIQLDAGTASIALTSFDFNWRVTGNSGTNNTSSSKQTNFALNITGSISGDQGTPETGLQGTGSPFQFRSIDLTGITLNPGEVYTLTFSANGTGFGHNASILDIALEGEITPVPEPTSLALLTLGGLMIARRRRG